MDLRKHINDVTGGALKDFRVLEGACYDHGVYYLIFGNMKHKTSKIVKVKAGKEKEVLKVSKTLKVGHANDCCVRGSIIYITHSGKKSVIHRVSASTLDKLPDITVKGCKGGFNAITCFGTGFLLKKMGSRKCYVVSDTFHYKSTITLSKTYKVGQGMTWYKGRLYRGSSVGQSKKNRVAVYNGKGKLLRVYHYKKKCELEDVFVVGGVLKIGIYRKYKKKGKKHFKAFIKKVKRL